MSSPNPQTSFFLLKCAHCEGHLKLPGDSSKDFYVTCPSCGGGLSGTGTLEKNTVNATIPSEGRSSSPLPQATDSEKTKTPGSRIPAILPRDSVPSAAKGFQSPEFGGASFAAPAAARPASPSQQSMPAPPEFQGKRTPPAKDTIIPNKRTTDTLAPRRPTNADMANAEYVKPDGWEIEKSEEKPVSTPDKKTPRAVLILLTGVVLSLCTWVSFKLIATSDELAERNAAENKARREAIEAQAPKDPEAAARQARRLAGESAYNFLHSQNLTALKKHVRQAEPTANLLDRLYPDPATFEQFNYKRITPDEEITISEDGKFFTVDVVQMDDTLKPLTLERVNRRLFLADWQSYVGYSEIPWTDLLVERPSEPVIIRARVTPGDFYANAFDNPNTQACFTLRDDLRQVTIYGYAPLRSSITTESLLFTDEEIADGTEKLVMLSVSYPPKTRKTNQVNIEQFVQDSWFQE